MKILSYNVNGIRAALNKGLFEWFKTTDTDVLCIQESKAQPDQIDANLFESIGYHGYFMSAEKKGYSGVGIICKQKPDKVVYGMGMQRYDSEGRVLRVDFGDFTIICVYVPSGTTGGIRQDFKMEFLADFERFVTNLRKSRPNLLICGDYNIAHTPIDINHPERQIGVSGFLPEERDWFTNFLATGMIDSFREKDKRPEQYSWWSYRAGSRVRNVGWRIDYHLVSEPLRDKINAVGILSDAMHSDHCPILIELSI